MNLQVIVSDLNADGTPYDHAVERFLADMRMEARITAGEPAAWDGFSYVLWFGAMPWSSLARCTKDFVSRFAARAIAAPLCSADASELVTHAPVAGVVHDRSYLHWREPSWPGEQGWPAIERRPGWGMAVPTVVAEAIGASGLAYPASDYSTIKIEGASTLPELVREYLLAYDRIGGRP